MSLYRWWHDLRVPKCRDINKCIFLHSFSFSHILACSPTASPSIVARGRPWEEWTHHETRCISRGNRGVRHSKANGQNETRAIVVVDEILSDIADKIIIDTAMLLSLAPSVLTSPLLFHILMWLPLIEIELFTLPVLRIVCDYSIILQWPTIGKKYPEYSDIIR